MRFYLLTLISCWTLSFGSNDFNFFVYYVEISIYNYNWTLLELSYKIGVSLNNAIEMCGFY